MKPRFLLIGLLVLASPLAAQTATKALRDGQAAFGRDDYWSAVDFYRDALKANPRYMEALQGLSESFFALGEYDEAAKQVQAALKLGPLSSPVNVLYGRVLLGQTQYEQALAQFQGVLAREPKNRAARFGLAEYEVMRGRLENAAVQFESLRKDDPTDLRALLSLMYIASARGDTPGFDKVLSDALRTHSEDPRVHFAAAEEMYRRKDRAQTRKYLDNFLAVSAKTSLRGWFLQTRLQLDEGRYQDALQTLDTKVIQGPKELRGNTDPKARYLRALALSRLDRGPEAAGEFMKAMEFDPANEAYAIAYEEWLLRKTKLEDPLRQNPAKLHLGRAQDLVSKNFQSLALDEYRRAVLLDGYSVKARLGRAEIWKRQGLKTSSLDELVTISDKVPTYKDVAFTDELEMQRSLYDSSLAATWGLSLDDLDSLNSMGTNRLYRPYILGVFYDRDASETADYGAVEGYADAFADEWGSVRALQVATPGDDQALPAQGFNDAFAQARQYSLEYFALVTFHEGLRDFSIQVNLYLGRTGRLIQTFNVYKKGTLPVTLGIREAAKVSAEAFPLRGSVLKRQNSDVLINLGKRDGVAEGQKFAVIRDGAAEPTGDAYWFAWNPTDSFGTWTAGASDDWTAVGKLEKTGFFDTVAIGDEVLLVKDAPKVPAPVPLPVSAVLQRDILSLR